MSFLYNNDWCLFFEMFKYEYDQLPDALNMFFVKNRYVHNYNTRNKDKLRPAIAKHNT